MTFEELQKSTKIEVINLVNIAAYPQNYINKLSLKWTNKLFTRLEEITI